MKIIDTHAHIYKEFYEDIDKVLENIKNSNIIKFINCSDNLENTIEVLELSKKYKGIMYPAIGFHPENADTITEEDIEKLDELINNNKVYAIGEIGLDYHYRTDNIEKQKKLFISMLDLATKYNIPVIIHSREANKDAMDILKNYKLKGVFHSFDGTIEEANEVLDMGFLIGVNGIITFKNAEEKRKVIKKLPLDKLMVETDSPFLTPEPFRKEVNEPEKVLYVLKKLAEIKEKPEEKVAEITTKNAINLFDLDV